MSVANLSVRRPVLMTVMALVIILLGAFGATNLGVREYPNVDYPLIQVRTSYPGANGYQGAYLHEPRRILVYQH